MQLGDAEVVARLQALESRRHALYAEELAVLAEADSRNLAGVMGHRDLASVTCEALRVNRAEARRRIGHARTLVASHTLTGQPVPPELPTVGEALGAGSISPEHVQAICATVDRFPKHATDDDRMGAETILTETAALHAPRTITKLGEEILARLDQDGPEPDHREPAEPARELHLHTRRNGRVVLKGELDAESGALLTGLLSPLTKPRSQEANGGTPDARSVGERQGDALAEILHLAATVAPTEAGEPVHLNVSMHLDDLRNQIGTATLDGAITLSAAQARRLSCDAAIIPTVLGADSEPLDIGRKTRIIPANIRRALILRDRGCAFPGCDRRASQCDGHHIQHWAEGGATALDNLALLCRHHHRIIHHARWRIHMAADGRPEFIPPPHVDSAQRPRRNPLHDTAVSATGAAELDIACVAA